MTKEHICILYSQKIKKYHYIKKMLESLTSVSFPQKRISLSVRGIKTISLDTDYIESLYYLHIVSGVERDLEIIDQDIEKFQDAVIKPYTKALMGGMIFLKKYK